MYRRYCVQIHGTRRARREGDYYYVSDTRTGRRVSVFYPTEREAQEAADRHEEAARDAQAY